MNLCLEYQGTSSKEKGGIAWAWQDSIFREKFTNESQLRFLENFFFFFWYYIFVVVFTIYAIFSRNHLMGNKEPNHGWSAIVL